jgi:hypothetical protein
MTCEFLQNETCDIARQIAGRPTPPVPAKTCQACLSARRPKTHNAVTVSVALAALADDPAKRDQVIALHGHHLVREGEPQYPSLARQAWNLAESLVAFVADGLRTCTTEVYRARLEICDACPYRAGHRCLSCGCFIAAKAAGRAFRCPQNRWKE